MKRLSVTVLSVMMTMMVIMAQGWPANYGGVMLQGFYWDSYQDSKWTNLTNQVDELSSYFNLIWVPNSGQTKEDQYNSSGNWGYENMGYMPVYWLKHNTCFGTEAELKAMIAAFKAKGTGIIEDVVINHKNGLTNWADFPDEKVTIGDKTYTLTWAQDMEALWGICKNDELFWDNGLHNGTQYKYANSTEDCLVNDDEGDNFDGCRDLDHTNAQVQQNIATYLDFLVNELGYAGFRYDMVKGYAGYYVGKYNSELRPKLPANQEFFSVGEYWDASYNNVVGNWINETVWPRNEDQGKIQSAAFDFPLKYSINDAFNNGHWGVLQGNKGIAGDPNMSRYCVTFVDNHDTYRNDYDRVNNNVLAANAFILGLPGTPCIFLPHWQQYKTEIKKMIAARKAAGINNQSKVINDWSNQNGFYMKVQGKQTAGQNTEDTSDDKYASIIVISGYIPESDYLDPKLHELIISGQNFAYYVSKDVAEAAKNNYQQIENANASDFAVYVRDNNEGNPYLYAWTGNGDTDQEKVLGPWPGKLLEQKVKLADGSTWYKQPFKHHDLKVIVHYNGGGNQKTNDISVNGDTYLCYWKGNELKHANYSSIYNSDPQLQYIDAYFDAPSGWNKIYTWEDAYYQQMLKPNGEFPGSDLSVVVGTSSTGNNIYRWRIDKNLGAGVPNNVIFSKVGENGYKEQTADFKLINAALYDTNGLTSPDMLTLNPSIALDGVTSINNVTIWDGSSKTVAQAQTNKKPNVNIYFPAGSYTVQAIVRGTAAKTLSLAAGSASSSVTLTGMESTSPSTVLPSGAVERNVTVENNGWLKVQSTCTLPEDGVLHIILSSDATDWQIGALTILKSADVSGKYQTVATTQTTQTNVDMTGNNHFSFFERGANPNALIKANSEILPYNVIVNDACVNLRLTDGAYDFNADGDFTATNITYDRQFTRGKKVTVCLPFAVTAAEVTAKGLTVYEFDQVSEDGILHFKEVGEMAANTPYMVVAGENTTPFAGFRSQSSSVAQTNALEVVKGEGSNAVTFKGTMRRQTLNSGTEATYYGYSNGEFVKVGNNVSINPFRAFIKMAGTSSSTAVNALFEDASAIRDINAATVNGSAIYTLDGRKVASGQQNLPKGVYIKGGKKYIIK